MESATNPQSTRLAAVILAIGLLISAALAIVLVLGPSGEPVVAKKDKKKTDQQAQTAASDEFDPQRDYDQSAASDELRAYHGEIFFARVDALEGEDEEPVAEGVPPHRVLTYLATVDRSLVGEARGQVELVYFGAYEQTVESGGFGPLRIGERYLFFAGADEARTEFYVLAGTGTILITSDRQEEELVEKYRPLIAEAEKHEQEAIARAAAWADARKARAGTTPTASIDPEHGPPGTDVTVRGENFGFMEATIEFGDDRAYADVSVGDGSFQIQITIPTDAPSGPFPIVVDDQQGFETEVEFTVTE